MKDHNSQTIIVQGLEQWHNDSQSESFNLYLELSKLCRVIYIAPPSKRSFSFLKKTYSTTSNHRILWEDRYIQISSRFKEEHHLIWVESKSLLSNNIFISKKAEENATIKLYEEIWNSLSKYVIDTCITSFNLINEITHLNLHHIPQSIRPSKAIFRLPTELTPEVLTNNLKRLDGYDFFISTSKEQDIVLNSAGYNSKILSKGFNYAHFSKGARQYSPASITKPSVLYIGDINEKLDLWLIEKIARSCPHFHFNFIGKVNIKSYTRERLESFDNIFFHENESFNNIPAWIHQSELCWIPFNKEYQTDSTTLNMYLSAGKPILSTSHSSVRDFDEVITIFTHEKSFIENSRLQMFIEDNSQKENRINVALNNNWENKAKTILEEIIEHKEAHREETLNLVS